MSTETKYTVAIKTNEEHKGKKCTEMLNCSMQSYIEDKVLEVLTAINFGLDINDDEISIELGIDNEQELRDNVNIIDYKTKFGHGW